MTTGTPAGTDLSGPVRTGAALGHRAGRVAVQAFVAAHHAGRADPPASTMADPDGSTGTLDIPAE